MANFWFFSLLRRKKAMLLLAGALFSAIGFAGLIFSSQKYEVRTDYLVSQSGSEAKDFYTLTRSAEYMGKILGEVMYSERFIAAIVETGKVSQEFLPFDKKDRLEKWEKMVKVQDRLDLGILQVTVLSDDARQAQRVSEAIGDVLIAKNGQFLGSGEKNNAISILSGPIAERNPSVKEIITVAIAGFFFGIVITFLVAFLREEVFRKKEEEASEIFVSDELA